jgi:branched-chain amino acid transport system substrate-binding protein
MRVRRTVLRTVSRWRGGAIGAVAMLCAAGCGSSSSSSSTVAASAAGLNASPIVFGSMTTVNNPTASFPGIFSALNAGADAINHSGGINGHPIKIWTCNSEYTASGELACARKAVAAGVIAMIGDLNGLASFKTYGGILSAAHIADIENTGPLPNGFEGDTTFPVTWPLSEFLPCNSAALAKLAGGKKIVEVEQVQPLNAVLDPLYRNMAKAEGLTYLKTIDAPTSGDMSSAVAQAEQSGANIVLMSLLGSGPQQFVRASSAAGAHYAICTAVGLSGHGGWAGTGSAAANVYLGGDVKPLNSDIPGMKQFVAQMAAAVARGDKDASTAPGVFEDEAIEAWLGLTAAVQAAKTISGPVTRDSFLSAMKKASVSFGGIIPPVNFATPPQTPPKGALPVIQPFQHVYNAPAYLWKWIPSQNDYVLKAAFANGFNEAATGAKQ